MTQNNKWYMMCGNEGDVVISTRVRFARNLKSFPFPNRMNEAQMKQCRDKIVTAINEGNSALADSFNVYDAEQMSEAQLASMVERHLISPEFARAGKGSLLLSEDESISIMINEEDHIRLQVLKPGLELNDALDMADKIDTLLDQSVDYAFDDKLGYLTCCPTNLGTGMRASVMLHLPALQEKKMISQLANTITKLGLTIRGIYGEGSQPQGALYQLSNQVTLGISEKAAIENLMSITKQLIAQERSVREMMTKNINVVDRVWRSYGILSNVRKISSEEFTSLISNVRLGVATGMIDHIKLDTINGLMVQARAGMITYNAGEQLDANQRDIRRAELIRNALSEDKQ